MYETNEQRGSSRNRSCRMQAWWTDRGATVNTSGGGASAGGLGRFLLGNNTAGGFAGSVTGASTTTAVGSRGTNPFINGSSTDTPFIPDLVGGAEIYGLLAGLDSTDPFFGALRAGIPIVPEEAVTGALMRVDRGPTPAYDDDFAGFDMLLFVSLFDASPSNTAASHAAPTLGIDDLLVDASFESALLTGGFATDPLFGGSGGPVVLPALGALDVWATLVPDTELIFNASLGIGLQGDSKSGVVLANGDSVYFGYVPEPGTVGLFAIGLIGLGVGGMRNRRR